MTKKHFIAIAKVFNANKPKPETSLTMMNELWANLREGMANVLADTNPAFDRARFLAACNK